jgi:hypothetical protein
LALARQLKENKEQIRFGEDKENEFAIGETGE